MLWYGTSLLKPKEMLILFLTLMVYIIFIVENILKYATSFYILLQSVSNTKIKNKNYIHILHILNIS